MPFKEIHFSTMDEFFAIMQGTKLNFILFGNELNTPPADALLLNQDEAGYFVNVRGLNKECFDRLMKNSAVELRANPTLGDLKTIPHIRSFVGGEGFVDTYFENEGRKIAEFVKRSRSAKQN
jgi:hypothetical protein